nr:hypothetical protein [uncultured Rhodoferax sp.]
MNTRSLLFSLLMAAVSSAGAQALAQDNKALPSRPLNLSVQPVSAHSQAAPAVLNPQEKVADEAVPVEPGAQLPYGSGFETRQQARTGGGHTGGNGASGGSGGNGGSGGSGGGGRGGADGTPASGTGTTAGAGAQRGIHTPGTGLTTKDSTAVVVQ